MEKVSVRNSSDENQVKDADRKDFNRQQREVDDLTWVLSEKKGRRFLWRFLSENCRVFKTCYSQDTNETYFLEGNRNVGLKLMDEINEINPDLYVKMIKGE